MPAVVIGRPPQKSDAMWAALKAHIIRERQKKKQEQEADAEVERQRKERERQQKQDVMTLGETREQISQLEQRLAQLKDEKHQLFLQLKKVLNEDDNRRRQLVKESNEVMEMYGYPGVTLGGHPQLFLQHNMPLAGRNPLYKVPATHTLLPHGALKRPRSPSPPNAAGYHQYTYKQSLAQAAYQKNIPCGPFYPASTTVGYTSGTSPAQTVYTYAGPQFAQPSPGAPTAPPSRDPGQEAAPPPPKHLYMTQTRPHASQPFLHVTIDPKPSFPEDNFYSTPIRPATHVPIHGGAIPIQQPPQGAKTGGITSGYPIRPPSSAPPPHVAPSVSTQHNVYVSQPSSGGRLVYSQACLPPSTPPTRYTVPPMQREA